MRIRDIMSGNVPPSKRNLEFLKHCVKQMPKGKRIKAFRSDSAGYQADIINYCEANDMEFGIGADLDEAVMGTIKAIAKEEWRPYKGGDIADTVHSMNKTKKAFRLIVIRKPYQSKMFGEEKAAEKYVARATNRTESTEEAIEWYGQRGECSENRIKELKIGFGMERMPCGQF